MHGEGIAVRIGSGRRKRFYILFENAIRGAVRVHIQAEVEEMLVVNACEIARERMAVQIRVGLRRILCRRKGFSLNEPAEEDFHFQSAVLMKDPIETVFVIPYGRDP
jgi:hypothetical protein